MISVANNYRTCIKLHLLLFYYIDVSKQVRIYAQRVKIKEIKCDFMIYFLLF